MHIPSSWAPLLKHPGAQRFLGRDRTQRGNALFPLNPSADPSSREAYAWSTDPATLKFTETLVRRLNDEFPVDAREDGFAGPSAIASDFNAALCVSGMGMYPAPIPLMSNRALIEEVGLKDEIKPADLPWAEELIHGFFRHYEPSALHIRKAGSTSAPIFTTDPEYKYRACVHGLHKADLLMSMVRARDFKGLLDEFGILLVYSMHERQQPNAWVKEGDKLVPKPRLAPSAEQARAGHGPYDNADLRVIHPITGAVIEGHQAMRRRDVFGMNGPANYITSAVFSGFATAFYNIHASTYKKRTPADKAEKAGRYAYTLGSDVKTMDKLTFKSFVALFCKIAKQYVAPELIQLLEWMFFAPFVAPWTGRGPAPADYNPCFGEPPLDASAFTNWPGLPSGISVNPIIGRLWMTFVYLLLYRDSGALTTPSDMWPFLRGENPTDALDDSSDDALMYTNDPARFEKLKEGKSSYAILEVEKVPIYLGTILYKDGGVVKAASNAATYVGNAMAREDSVHRKHPLIWALGVVSREVIYSDMPTYSDVRAITSDTLRSFFGSDYVAIARAAFGTTRPMSFAEAVLMDNPSAIHYKVDYKDVPEQLMTDLFSSVSADIIETTIGGLINKQKVTYVH